MIDTIKPNLFRRELFIDQLEKVALWDLVVIGGGATGLGTALDASSRGFKVLLLEQADFAKGTSSRSTKLVHGGVRYLAQGNIRLVYDALKERGILFDNAPHVVKKLPLIIPCYDWSDVVKYFIGLKLYDWLSGKYSIGKSEFLSSDKVIAILPGIKKKNLKGGIRYYDGQFDDARLAINLAQTCAEKGGVVLNYFKVTDLLKGEDNKVNGVVAFDIEKSKEYRIKSKTVINASGVFVNDILKMDSETKPMVRPSQGVHIVVDQTFLNSKSALLIPKTTDGRVLFVIPWNGHLLLGTTDTPLSESSLEPRAIESEINFIIDTAREFLDRPIMRKDIRSVFAGLRPLKASNDNAAHTKEISRDHKLIVSPSGLITITGGKWTTYRKMAEDTVDKAIETGKLNPSVSITKSLKIHGHASVNGATSPYGSDEMLIEKIIAESPVSKERLSDKFSDIRAQVVLAVRNEMARTVEDVLARRLRTLFLDAKTAIEIAPSVALIMARELGWDKEREEAEVNKFVALAGQYLVGEKLE